MESKYLDLILNSAPVGGSVLDLGCGTGEPIAGQQLYHASLSTKEYENLLKEASFNVLIHKVRDPECGQTTVWVAKRI